jgi:hypothetical protein
MSGWDVEVSLEVEGRAGPPRSEEESEADRRRDEELVAAKRARLSELQARFEAEGFTPARAKVMAAQAYHGEV